MKLHCIVLAAVLASAAAACGGSVETPQTQASAASKAPVAQNAHGAIKLLGDALGEVALRPEQRTEIEKLANEAEARHQPTASGHKDLILAFADQVEKGTVDRAALQPKIDKIAGETAAVRDADRAALVKLHELLDKQQRNDLADALEKHFKAKRGELHVRGGDKGGPGFGNWKHLAEDLNLTDDQKAKIHDVVRESFKERMKEGREHHKGGAKHHGGKHHNPIESFREDKFEPQGVGAIGFGAPLADHVIQTAEKVLPILTPEQRKVAAEKLRALANEGGKAAVTP